MKVLKAIVRFIVIGLFGPMMGGCSSRNSDTNTALTSGFIDSYSKQQSFRDYNKATQDYYSYKGIANHNPMEAARLEKETDRARAQYIIDSLKK